MQMFNILIVEDDEIDATNIERCFQKINMANPLFKAENGEEALALLEEKPELVKNPTIILLDLNMPRMNGFDFLEHIRSDDELKNLIVVVLTSSNHDKDVCKSYDYNVAGYMTKPVEMPEFIEKMAAIGKYWSLCEMK